MRIMPYFFAALTMAWAGQAAARPWNPTPRQAAMDYTSITHNRGEGGGTVIVRWISAPAFDAVAMAQLLNRYTVISITHTVPSVLGITYEDIGGVEVTNLAGEPLKEVGKDDVPPGIAALIAGADAFARQSTAGKAKGKTLVFEAGGLRACEKGGLAVLYGGERYTFETPIPGCPEK